MTDAVQTDHDWLGTAEPMMEAMAAAQAGETGRTPVVQQHLTGERIGYAMQRHDYEGVTFADGESALKHATDITLRDCVFEWKYPLWYDVRLTAKGCTWLEATRAGLWYCKDVSIEGSAIDSPKNLRRCTGVSLKNVAFTNGNETLWDCRDVTLDHVTVKGDYFAMNSADMTIDGLTLVGGYSFDGARNVTVSNSRIVGLDVFWNAENVTVRNSHISGAYVAWNSRNVTFENCTIESLQGLCYVDGLTMRNCRLINSELAFEYSDVDAELIGPVRSIFNPRSGRIVCDGVEELTLDPAFVDPKATAIVTPDGRDLTTR